MEPGSRTEETKTDPVDTSQHPALSPEVPISPQEIPASQQPKACDVTDDAGSQNGEPSADNGNSPLHYACQAFDKKLVDELLRQGARVDCTNKKERSPLHEMVQSYLSLNLIKQAGHYKKLMDITGLLRRAGLDVNCQDARRQTPLHYVASYADQADVIRALQSSGARINLQDNMGQTPLHVAVAKGNMANVIALVESGADPNIQNRAGQTPVHISAKGKHHEEVLRWLLRCGGNVNRCDRGYQSPLHVAAKAGREQLVRILLTGGARVDGRDTSGQTALHLAAAHDITGSVCGLLLKMGASRNVVDAIYMETPIHKAVRMRMVHNVQTLLRFKAKTDIQDVLGETPYHKATSVDEISLWKCLMADKRSTAGMKIQNERGLTPFQKALKTNGHTAIAMMKQYGVQDL